MIIPEYGRNIQKMVAHAKSIENKEERNTIAAAIISVMGQLNPHLREDLEAIYKKLVNDGMVLGKSVSLTFSNINNNMPVKSSTPYVPINAEVLGLSKDDLALSKRNEPLLRNVTFRI